VRDVHLGDHDERRVANSWSVIKTATVAFGQHWVAFQIGRALHGTEHMGTAFTRELKGNNYKT
jgi:hypothetical protein